jgi:hypothetical protein
VPRRGVGRRQDSRAADARRRQRFRDRCEQSSASRGLGREHRRGFIVRAAAGLAVPRDALGPGSRPGSRAATAAWR